MKSLAALMNLKGRVALLTGGAGHLGRAMAESLAELGADIVLLDIDEAANEAAEHIQARFGTKAIALVADLTDDAVVREVPRLILAQLHRLDILVNNAALVGTSEVKGWAVPFADQRTDTWRLALDINLTAPFALTQACREALLASGHGSIINISSIYSVAAPDLRLYAGTTLGNPAAYAASKAGLVQLTRWLSTVLAPAIRANAISVGGVWREQSGSFHERYIARTPLCRMAIEEDLKGAIAYLASDMSNYVTGHNLVVDGGWTVW